MYSLYFLAYNLFHHLDFCHSFLTSLFVIFCCVLLTLPTTPASGWAAPGAVGAVGQTVGLLPGMPLALFDDILFCAYCILMSLLIIYG